MLQKVACEGCSVPIILIGQRKKCPTCLLENKEPPRKEKILQFLSSLHLDPHLPVNKYLLNGYHGTVEIPTIPGVIRFSMGNLQRYSEFSISRLEKPLPTLKFNCARISKYISREWGKVNPSYSHLTTEEECPCRGCLTKQFFLLKKKEGEVDFYCN